MFHSDRLLCLCSFVASSDSNRVSMFSREERRFIKASRFAGPRNYSLLEQPTTQKTYASALDKAPRMLLLLKHFHGSY